MCKYTLPGILWILSVHQTLSSIKLCTYQNKSHHTKPNISCCSQFREEQTTSFHKEASFGFALGLTVFLSHPLQVDFVFFLISEGQRSLMITHIEVHPTQGATQHFTLSSLMVKHREGEKHIKEKPPRPLLPTPNVTLGSFPKEALLLTIKRSGWDSSHSWIWKERGEMTESEQKLCYTNGRRTCVCDIDVVPTPTSADSARRRAVVEQRAQRCG